MGRIRRLNVPIEIWAEKLPQGAQFQETVYLRTKCPQHNAKDLPVPGELAHSRESPPEREKKQISKWIFRKYLA